MSADRGNVLLLSIDRQHVEAILTGKKRFELRKALPHHRFRRVYLFQTGGAGVVAWFDARQVIRKPLEELWRTVGAAATPKRRFDAYFEGFINGYAIEVGRAERLAVPLPAKTLRRVDRKFSAPMSSKILRVGHPLHDFLESVRERQIETDDLPIRLGPISKTATRTFRKLVFEEIAPRYDEIDDSFVDGILETHQEGHDPVGFFTSEKEAVTIKGRRGKIIGFSTITYKTGGSAKTGPTILLEEFRGQGIGQDVRTALEYRILSRGYRKIYCTAPAISDPVVRYLLTSNYHIEAQLREQYTERHDELVFGKMLLSDVPELFLPDGATTGASARLVAIEELADRMDCAVQLADLLRRAWFPFGDEASERVAEEVVLGEERQSRKPKTALLLVSGTSVVGAALLLPKRGGSVKGLIIARTGHTPSLARLVVGMMSEAIRLSGRRLYVLHPVGDVRVLGILRQEGFLPEGLLLAPYAPGQDVAVYGTPLETKNARGGRHALP
jgi:predicted transcriptional regulator